MAIRSENNIPLKSIPHPNLIKVVKVGVVLGVLIVNRDVVVAPNRRHRGVVHDTVRQNAADTTREKRITADEIVVGINSNEVGVRQTRMIARQKSLSLTRNVTTLITQFALLSIMPFFKK